MNSFTTVTSLKSYDDLLVALSQLGYGTMEDVMADLDRLMELESHRPPDDYLCHVCFQKGHYIKDCARVSFIIILKKA